MQGMRTAAPRLESCRTANRVPQPGEGEDVQGALVQEGNFFQSVLRSGARLTHNHYVVITWDVSIGTMQ